MGVGEFPRSVGWLIKRSWLGCGLGLVQNSI